MKFKTIKKTGWKVTCDNGVFYLTYLPGVVGELGASYQVNEEIYKKALDENIELIQLIEEFDIIKKFHKVYDIKRPELPFRENTPTKYYGRGFIATKEDNKYFLEYQLARHGGGSRRFEITKEVYEEARTGKYSNSELFKKYNLYHLDVPENDVK